MDNGTDDERRDINHIKMIVINEKKYFDTDDVCKMFHTTPHTWNKWRSKYCIKHVRIGKRLLFPQDEIERMLKQCEGTYEPIGRNPTYYTDDK